MEMFHKMEKSKEKAFVSVISKMLLCLLLVNNGLCDKSSKTNFVSLDEQYKSAAKAYNEDRWSECINIFEELIHLNKLYNRVVANCGQQCRNSNDLKLVSEDIEDLIIYETFMKRTDCVQECRKKGLTDVAINSDHSDDAVNNMAHLEPYNYIHLCYFKMNLLQKAACAAFTYMAAHPSDQNMQKNYEFYIRQPEVNIDEVADMESPNYKIMYQRGADAYEKEQWGDTMSTMEEVLRDYLASENMCRHTCVPNSGSLMAGRAGSKAVMNQHFENIAHYFASVLQCKQKCQAVVGPLGFTSGIDFLANVLNHIQIAYYHLGMTENAAMATESFLILHPEDEDMLNNKKIYINLLKKDVFDEMPEIRYYWKRDNYEKKLLKYYNSKKDGSYEL